MPGRELKEAAPNEATFRKGRLIMAGEKAPLRVILAQPRGFCAGVERAIEIV